MEFVSMASFIENCLLCKISLFRFFLFSAIHLYIIISQYWCWKQSMPKISADNDNNEYFLPICPFIKRVRKSNYAIHEYFSNRISPVLVLQRKSDQMMLMVCSIQTVRFISRINQKMALTLPCRSSSYLHIYFARK